MAFRLSKLTHLYLRRLFVVEEGAEVGVAGETFVRPRSPRIQKLLDVGDHAIPGEGFAKSNIGRYVGLVALSAQRLIRLELQMYASQPR